MCNVSDRLSFRRCRSTDPVMFDFTVKHDWVCWPTPCEAVMLVYFCRLDWSSSSISMCDRERIHLKHEQPGEAKGRGGGKPKDMSKKAILLSGPPGIGKTSSASIISRCACCLVAAAGSHLSAYTLAVTLHYSSMPPFWMMSYAYVLHSESPSATCHPHVAEVPSFVLVIYLMG